MYVPMSAQASLAGHSNFLSEFGVNGGGHQAIYAAAIGDGKFFNLFYQISPQIDEASFLQHPGEQVTAMPLDRWFCLEWHFDGVAPSMSLYVDGDLVPTSVFDNRDPPTTVEFLIGPQRTMSDVWLDSIAIGTSRIRCDR